MKAYAFIAPSLLILTVFVFIPLAGAIGISLMNIDIYMKNISFAGIANYIKMFQDERVANATFHTFYFALLEVPLQMIVALLLLMFMLRNTKLHKLLRTVFYLPYVCSMTAVSIMWSMLLNTHYGMLPYLLGKIGITMPNMLSSTTWAMPTVIFVTVWKGFGYTLTILSAAALGVSESLYEAAEIDGASTFQRFRVITLPMLMPAFTVVFFLTLANCFKLLDQNIALTDGAFGTRMLATQILRTIKDTTPPNYGQAQAQAVIFFVLIAVVTLIQVSVTKKREVEM